MERLENTQIEFKREYTEIIKKEVVAFANTQGGTIYIGIDDEGKIVGLAEPDKTLQQVANMLHNSVRPDLTLFSQCYIEEREGKAIIKVVVQRGTGRPYYITEKGLKPAGVYVRVGSSSMPVSTEAIRKMIKESDGEDFETTRALKQDLTFASLQKEFRAVELDFDDDVACAFGMVGSDGLYTNLAYLLSDQCEHSIKIAVFQGRDKSAVQERHECEGSLMEQYRTAMTFLRKLQERRPLLFPEIGLKESLLNAVVHRDYALSGSTLMSIFSDRMEIVSLGGLVQNLSPQDLSLGVSLTRNERLSEIFYRLRLIDACGAGIARINDSYRGANAKPEFISTEHVFVTVLPNLYRPEPILPRFVTVRHRQDKASKQAKHVSRRKPKRLSLIGLLQEGGRALLRLADRLFDEDSDEE